MKPAFIFLLISLSLSTYSFAQGMKEEYNVPLSGIRLSDPFIYLDETDKTYYMYGSGGGGVVYGRASKDLRNWTGPFAVYRFPAGHWAGDNAPSWASEVHKYKGKYYLFTTSHSSEVIETIPGRCDIPRRATQVYVADSPRGPFKAFTDVAHTPANWASLDGTLWVEDGIPYMVFCHEWLQVFDGTMDAVRLPDDLGVPSEPPFTLFKASDAKWPGEMLELGEKTNGLDLGGYVTDGPWLFKTQTGRLGMTWSSWGEKRYALGIAYSKSGKVAGPWVQDKKPLFAENGGHGMLFKTFDGKLMLSLHFVDPKSERPGRQPIFYEVDDSGNKLKLKKNGVIIK